ncbi:tetratricopeptide repeat protein [Oscillatoria sp. CS-180]|uniref:tetratricopeptide repeat protein n=1 Tax=Oscillatoria sp. CS-180 TaxID=3021720 RepID=UPI00232F204B|nr:tetratricopeptide repeat protein [Oscillatoria sp. CS-180]MDB9525846.1 tetratricopeptide repeat protein [Oscillatoria sp. CS-180]
MFLPDESLNRVAKFAPDFWAWRMVVIRFKSLSESVKSQLEKVTKKNAFYQQDERDIIPRLLMEYDFGVLTEDKDAQDLKSSLKSQLGFSFYKSDNLDIAKSMLTEAIEEDSSLTSISKANIYFCLGRIELRQDHDDHALNLFNRSIAEFEGFEEGQFRSYLKSFFKKAIAFWSTSYRLTKRYRKPLANLTRRTRLDLGQYRLANSHIVKRFGKTIAVFLDAVEFDRNYTRALANRGAAYGAMKRYSEALADLDKAIEIKPDYTWAFAGRGITYRLMKNYSEALDDFDRAIQIDPEYKWAITQRGFTYQLMERYSEALTDFDRAIQIDPEYKWAIAQRGFTYQLMERYSEALADFDHAIELAPEYDWAIAQRGFTYRLIERYSEALADFDWAIQLDPEDKWVISKRGQTYRLIERYSEALADFDRAVELDPEYEWAIAQRSFTYLLMHRFEKALEECHRAIELGLNNDLIYCVQAIVYLALQKSDEAEAAIAKVIALAEEDYEKDSEDTDNIFGLAIFHLINKDLEQSQNFYQEAISKDPSSLKIREAIYDLKMLLKVLPGYPGAEEMQSYLNGVLDQHRDTHLEASHSSTDTADSQGPLS